MTTYLVLIIFTFTNGDIEVPDPMFVDFASHSMCMSVTEAVVNEIAPDVRGVEAGWSCTPIQDIKVIKH